MVWFLLVELVEGVRAVAVYAQHVINTTRRRLLVVSAVVAWCGHHGTVGLQALPRLGALADSSANHMLPSGISVERRDDVVPEYVPQLGVYAQVPLSFLAPQPRLRSLLGASTLPMRSEQGRVSGFVLGINTESPISTLMQRVLGMNSLKGGWYYGLQGEFQVWDMALTGESATAKHAAWLSFTSLAVSPLLRFTHESGFAVQAAVRVGMVVGSRLLHIDTDAITSRPDTLRNGRLEGFSPLQTGIVFTAAYPIALKPDNSVSARVELTWQTPLFNSGGMDATEWGRDLPRLRLGASLMFDTEESALTRRERTSDTLFVRDTATAIVDGKLNAPRVLRTARTVELPERLKPREQETLDTKIAQWFAGDSAAFAPLSPRSAEEAEEKRHANRTIVREMYLREIPKPKPLLTASVEAEFVGLGGKGQKNVTVSTARTVVRRYAMPPSVPEVGFLQDTVFKPYVIADTLLTSQLPTIRFYPRIISEEPIERWRLLITQRGVVLADLSAVKTANAATSKSQIEPAADKELADWNPSEDIGTIIRADEQLSYKLFVTTAQEETMVADSGSITVARESGNSSAAVTRSVDMVFLETLNQQNTEQNTVAQVNTGDTQGNLVALGKQSVLLLGFIKPLIRPSSRLRLIIPETEAVSAVHVRSLIALLATILAVEPERIVTERRSTASPAIASGVRTLQDRKRLVLFVETL